MKKLNSKEKHSITLIFATVLPLLLIGFMWYFLSDNYVPFLLNKSAGAFFLLLYLISSSIVGLIFIILDPPKK